MIRLIAAVALGGAIGKDNGMLWKIPEDLQYYKSRTTSNVVIIGRKTYESLPKVALKNRYHIVISRGKINPLPDNVYLVHTPQEAIKLAENKFKDHEIYIAGGQTIYKQLLGECDYVYITWVGREYSDADCHFPLDDLRNNFVLLSESGWIESDGDEPSYKFSTYKKIK